MKYIKRSDTMLYYNDYSEELTDEERENRNRYNFVFALAMFNALHR